MKIKLKKLVPEAVIPSKANPTDAGYDLVAVNDGVISAEGYTQYNTGIAIELPEGYHAEIACRSSISKYDIILANPLGVIDNAYRGEILVRFKVVEKFNSIGFVSNNTFSPKAYKRGDKIAQLLIRKTEHADFEEVSELSNTVRGDKGFGSSGN